MIVKIEKFQMIFINVAMNMEANKKKKVIANNQTNINMKKWENTFNTLNYMEKYMKMSPKTKKKLEEYGYYHIDCFSKYIKMSLISFFLLLFQF